MSDERIDAMLDAWLEEAARADRAERRLIVLEGVLSRLLRAIGSTSFTPTPELEAVLNELMELTGLK